MEIKAVWSQPLILEDGSRYDLNLYFSTENIPSLPGCYIFYNKFGKSYSIIYIGKADILKRRLHQQMNNSRLMLGIKNNKRGKKYLIYCTINNRQKQNIQKNLLVVERQLIKTALANGHELLNRKGALINYNHISFAGNRTSEKMISRKIAFEK